MVSNSILIDGIFSESTLGVSVNVGIAIAAKQCGKITFKQSFAGLNRIGQSFVLSFELLNDVRGGFRKSSFEYIYANCDG